MENNEKKMIDEFLSLFKILENKVVTISNLDDEYISYSKAISYIHARNLDPIIFNDNNFQILKQAGDLRNLLSHNDDICLPTSSFFDTFKIIANKIIGPDNIYSIANKKIVYVKKDYSLLMSFKLMIEKSLSHLPILDDEYRIKGILSRSSLFDYMIVNNLKNIDISSLEVKDLYQVTEIHSHLNESFIIAKKSSNLADCYKLLVNKNEHDKNVAMILITEDGTIYDKLLGIITISDFNKVVSKEV